MPSASEVARDKEQELGGGQPDATPSEKASPADWFSAMQQGMARTQAIGKAQERQAEEQSAEMAPLVASTQEAIKKPPPAIPGTPDLPKPPRQAIRPFMEGMPGEAPVQTLNRTLMGLGLMAQMAVGISRDNAQGALAAYTGALTGWQHGDRERGNNEWLTYLRQVDNMQKDFNNRMREYQRTWDQYQYDIDRRGIEMQLVAAKHQEDRRGLELIAKNQDRYMQELGMTGQMLEKMRQDNWNNTFKIMMERQRSEDKRWTEMLHAQTRLQVAEMQHQQQQGKTVGETGKIWMDAKGNYAPSDMVVKDTRGSGFQQITPKEEAIVHTLPQAMTMLNNLAETSRKLRDAGGFRTASGIQGLGQSAYLATQGQMGDVTQLGGTLRLWEGQKSELISLYRSLGEKGNIAAKVLVPQLQATSPSAGFPAVAQMLKYMEGQLLADVQQSRIPGFAERLPRTPDILSSGDERYKKLQADPRYKGNRAAIEKDFGVLVLD